MLCRAVCLDEAVASTLYRQFEWDGGGHLRVTIAKEGGGTRKPDTVKVISDVVRVLLLFTALETASFSIAAEFS